MSIDALRPLTKMSIRTKLRVNAAVTIGLALVVALTVFISSGNMEEAERSERLAFRVIDDVSGLSSLSYAYLLLKSTRPKVQWQVKHASLGKALSAHIAVGAREEAVLASLRANHEQLKRLFEAVSARIEEGRPGAGITPAPYDELNEGLTAQLMARAETMSNEAFLLGHNTSRRLDAVRQTSFILIVASALMLMLSATLTASLIARSIGRSLAALERGTQRIASGDLDYRVPAHGNDEISRLSDAFNGMTARLKATYHRLEGEIAERRQAQDALRTAHTELEERVAQRTAALSQKTGELQETNKELESFAYTISHDLRAPLRAVNSFAHTLADREASCLSDDGKRRLAIIEANAVKMGQLIDDLLMFSRAGRTALNLTEIDMNALLGEVLDDLKLPDPGKRLGVHAGPLPAAYGDPALIRVVLVNLLSNAVKFTRHEPEPWIEVGGAAQNGELLYSVKDNGVGFDMKYYDKLFGVFERLVTEEEFEGTGVGLAIVHRLVTRHGGRVWAEATPGEGADFYFTLPYKG